MKSLILITLLLRCCLAVKAQLNQSQSQVKQAMSNEKGWRFINYGTALDGKLDGAFFLQYGEDKQLLGKSFYFVNDSCKLIKFSYLNKHLKNIIKDMNSRFISKGDNIWIDEKEHSKYELIPDKEGLGLFDILETPYSASN
ncbi:MAG TPA: hypothetical protein VG367_05375 [Mucilaginibacter sp.]|nr:hypothetical protein [Mucilaginibacter sp.]